MLRHLIVLVVATVAAPVGAAHAGAPPIVTPSATCLGYEHFPAVPVQGGPTKLVVGTAVDPALLPEMLTVTIGGASGDQTGSGPFSADGFGLAELPLFQFGDHVITQAVVTTLDSGDIPVDIDAITPGGTFVVNDVEPMCDDTTLRSLAPAPTTTTLPPTTTAASTTAPATTAPATTPTTAPPTTAAAATIASTTPETTAVTTPTTAPVTTPGDDGDGDGGGGWFPGVLIGLGAALLLGGAYLVFGGRKNCDPEREALASAQRRLEAINETLEEALSDLLEHEGELEQLEQELAELDESVARGSSTEGSTRYYSVGGKRMSQAAVDAERTYLNSMIEIESGAVDRAEARVREWSDRFDAAAADVRDAEQALAECEGVAAPPGVAGGSDGGTDGGGGGGPEGGPTEPTSPTGPGVVVPPPPVSSTPRRQCEEGATYVASGGAAERFQQVVDFSVIVQVMEGSERKVGEANVMTWNLASAGANLDALGKLLGATGAGTSVANGLGSIGRGSYVMGGAGLVKGTATGTMATGLTDVSVPTSPPAAVTEAAEQIAKLGALVSAKVGEWIAKNELYDVRMTLFNQTIIATPYLTYRCVNGRWECTKVWQYDVGPLRRHGSTNERTFRLSSDIYRHQMQSHINRLGAVGRNAVAASLRRRADFDARHQPGPCS